MRTAGTTVLAEGSWHKGQYRNPSDLTICVRCGITRITKSDRPRGMCIDCRGMEKRIQPEPLTGGRMVRKGLVWVFQPEPERMSAEDRAWCERQADSHFWTRWERANRDTTNPLQAEAERRATGMQIEQRKAA